MNQPQQTRKHLATIVISSIVALFFWLLPQSAHAQSIVKIAKAPVSEAATEPPLCRFGLNSSHSGTEKITDFDLAALRSGWYIDYRADATTVRPAGWIMHP